MKNYCDISILLDKSSSMLSIKGPTIEGFNTFLQTQKEKNPTAVVTLAQFSDNYQLIKESKNVRTFEDLTDYSFNPSGMTALNDSIAKLINETGHRLCKIPESDRPDKVLVVIITDGEENASRVYSPQQIEQMIKHQQEKYSWDFIYIGANQDAVLVGGKLGIRASNTLNYNATNIGTRSSFGKMSDKVSLMSNNAAYSSFKTGGYFTEQDKEEVIKNV